MTWKLQLYYYINQQPVCYIWDFNSQAEAQSAGSWIEAQAGASAVNYRIINDKKADENQPFIPAVGQTQTLNVSQTSQVIVIDGTGKNYNSILVIADVPANKTPYMRISVESSTVIVATNTDIPLPGSNNPIIKLFGNPNPSGKTSIAVVATAAGQMTVSFTPGTGQNI